MGWPFTIQIDNGENTDFRADSKKFFYWSDMKIKIEVRRIAKQKMGGKNEIEAFIRERNIGKCPIDISPLSFSELKIPAELLHGCQSDAAKNI